VEEVCDRFEAAWRTGQRPQIEQYLGDTPQPVRRRLLGELLALELDYRRANGETPVRDEYWRRFPDQKELLRAALNDPSEANASATPMPEMAEGSPSSGAEAIRKIRDTLPERITLCRLEVYPTTMLWPTVPGYEIVGKLGQGGMGVVYKARHLGCNRLVALKMIRDGALAGPEQAARFYAEAEAVARLQHPNIVQIYDVGVSAGLPYLALELVDGGSLAEQLKGTPQPPHRAAQLIETLARAMHGAHQQGIVHRDLKPANILLQSILTAEDAEARRGTAEASLPLRSSASSAVKDCIPKIIDFGLAKRMPRAPGARDGSLPAYQTQSGEVLGTPSYMAPEQATGRSKDTGPGADVYALGAILYEALTGRPPFRAATTFDTLMLACTVEPVPPRRFRPNVPADLDTICLKCLEKDPRRRYESAAALAEDLHRFLAGERVHARPSPLPVKAWKWAKRRPTLTTLLAVLGAASVSFLGLVLWYNAQLRAAVLQARREVEQQCLAEKPFGGKGPLSSRIPASGCNPGPH
jgi:serine/threonine protein kinase